MVCGKPLSEPDMLPAGLSPTEAARCPGCGKMSGRSIKETDDYTKSLIPPLAELLDQRNSCLVFAYVLSRWARLFHGRIIDALFWTTVAIHNGGVEMERRGLSFQSRTTRLVRIPLEKVTSYQHLKGWKWGHAGDQDLRRLRRPLRIWAAQGQCCVTCE